MISWSQLWNLHFMFRMWFAWFLYNRSLLWVWTIWALKTNKYISSDIESCKKNPIWYAFYVNVFVYNYDFWNNLHFFLFLTYENQLQCHKMSPLLLWTFKVINYKQINIRLIKLMSNLLIKHENNDTKCSKIFSTCCWNIMIKHGLIL